MWLRMVFSLLENMFAALCGSARLAVVQKCKPTIGATVLSSLVSCFLLLSFYILGIVAKLLYSFVKFSVVVVFHLVMESFLCVQYRMQLGMGGRRVQWSWLAYLKMMSVWVDYDFILLYFTCFTLSF